MKKTLFFFILFALLQTIGLQAQKCTEMNLVSCFQPDMDQIILLNINGQKSVRYWDKDYVKIEYCIKTKERQKSTTEWLESIGRYKSELEREHFTIKVSLPDMNKMVKVNNKNFFEELTYKIYLPHGTAFTDLYTIQNEDSSIAQID